MVWLIANGAFVVSSLFILPWIIGDYWAYVLALYLLYAIACLGVGLSWGQAGLLSLGQGFFVGIGAYLSGFSLIYYHDSLLLYPLLIISALIPAMLAYGIGRLIFYQRTQNSAFFALITLALLLLAMQIAISWGSVTGGFNGLRDIPAIKGMNDFQDAYILSAFGLIFAVIFVAWLTSSPLGILWRALSQDDVRLGFFGFDAPHLKAIAFAASGFLGGLAGVLYAPENSLVTPDLFGFILSTNFIIWVAIGGYRTLYGPVLGAIIIGILTITLRETVTYWEAILAAIFIITVLYFKNGFVGMFEPRLKSWLSDKYPRGLRIAPKRNKTDRKGNISVQNLNLRIGNISILNDLNLSFEKQGIYCLIGPNGAGKTTFFNVITGELKPQTGAINVFKQSLKICDTKKLSQQGLARKFQTPRVFDDLTISENLSIALWSGRINKWDLLKFYSLDWDTPILQELKKRFDFLQQKNTQARSLSHGQRQILDIAMVICTEPKLMLLDEPCAGLSRAETEQVIDVIRWAVKTLKASALIIEHDMALVRELAQHVFVMHNGSLLAEGSVKDIQKNKDVKNVYVGGDK